MGQGDSKHTTHVANGYHEDVKVWVRANRIEVYEEEMGIKAKIGGNGLPVAAGAAYNSRQKRNFVMQDPGFSTIKPGCYFGFAESGPDGRVFVTIQIGSDIPHFNVQVHNGANVLVDEERSLRNVKNNKIWTDTSGQIHIVGTPAKVQELPNKKLEKRDESSSKASDTNEDEQAAESEISEDEHEREANLEQWQRAMEDAEVISLAGELMDNQEPIEDGTRTPARHKPATAETDATGDPLCLYRNKGPVNKYFGTEGDAVGQMYCPRGICSTASGDIVVADTCNHRIQIFDVNGHVKGIFGSRGTSEGQFEGVVDVCVTSRGRIVASDMGNHRIQIFDEQGHFVRKFGSRGSGNGKLKYPIGVATDDKGFIYVCDTQHHRVQVFSKKGKFVRKFGSGILKWPNYLSVTSSGRVVVTSDSIHIVHVFDSYGGRHLFQFRMDGKEVSPRGVATDEHDNIIVCENHHVKRESRVRVFTNCGEFVTCFGSHGSKPGQMNFPIGVCVLSDGRIAVSDSDNHRVQIF